MNNNQAKALYGNDTKFLCNYAIDSQRVIRLQRQSTHVCDISK